jgi:hypothetical protein
MPGRGGPQASGETPELAGADAKDGRRCIQRYVARLVVRRARASRIAAGAAGDGPQAAARASPPGGVIFKPDRVFCPFFHSSPLLPLHALPRRAWRLFCSNLIRSPPRCLHCLQLREKVAALQAKQDAETARQAAQAGDKEDPHMLFPSPQVSGPLPTSVRLACRDVKIWVSPRFI